ncbi:MAG: PQQ-binding-like beta-propeller repeat protein [Planctomycetota bacterium]|nr:PQQ-binding-like beta-propeller repeat protein [Planctomycetota bacterium]
MFRLHRPLADMVSHVMPLRLLSVLLLSPLPLAADDWPQWGGPQGDCVWRETGVVDELPSGLLPRKWSTPVGEGYSGPAVADGLVYVTDRQSEARTERVLCLDAETGAEVWKHEYPARYTISYPAGPRATPVIDAGRVYTIGAQGDMFCFNARDGAILWQKNFEKDYAANIPVWGMAAAPVVDGDRLITLVGGADGATVVAFDKTTGKELWRAIDDPAVGYVPPRLFAFGGKLQVICWHPEAVTSLDPETGKVVWEVPFKVQQGLCVSSPQRAGNRLFFTAFYNGPLMLEVADDGQSAKVVWKGSSNSEIQTDGLHSIMPTPIVTSENIYGVCSYGQLRGLDADTGKRLWETFEATGNDRWWNAFLIPNGDRVFLHNEQGDLIIARLSPQGYDELSRAKLVEPTRTVRRRMTIWSHPAFAMKSVFARNDREIVRVDLAK